MPYTDSLNPPRPLTPPWHSASLQPRLRNPGSSPTTDRSSSHGISKMTHDQMLQTAYRPKPKVLLPFHWEVWRGETGDPLALGKMLALNPPPFDVRLLKIGDRISYE